MKRKRLALLAGGDTPEREVSLNGAAQVYDALDKEKYDVVRYDPRDDLARLAADADSIDAALLILHGPNGEDGTIQGMLELLRIPYQGSGVLGSAAAMNKLTTKHLYAAAGIPFPQYLVLTQNELPGLRQVRNRLGWPVVVKPVVGGSSIGTTIVTEDSAFSDAVARAFALDDQVLVESFIKGIELTGGVIGNDAITAFPLVEIIPDNSRPFFDYEAKYTPGVTREICPARINDDIAEIAKSLAVSAHKALFCRGYSRTDMILKGNDIYVLETNTIPGMTKTSLLPQGAAAGGFSFPALLDRLIELGIEEHRRKARFRQTSFH